MRLFSDILFIAVITQVLLDLVERGAISQQNFVTLALVLSFILGAAAKADSKHTVDLGTGLVARWLREGVSVIALWGLLVLGGALNVLAFATTFSFALVTFFLGWLFGLTWILVVGVIIAILLGGGLPS